MYTIHLCIQFYFKSSKSELNNMCKVTGLNFIIFLTKTMGTNFV